MDTKIEKNFHIPAPIAQVWSSLSDPADIVSCVPGASITEKIDERNYKGQVVAKFGPIKASYNGDIEILELDEASHKMVLNGKGLDSKGKGSAEMDMVGELQEKDGGTDVSFTMNISIIGKLAQFGSRLIGDVSEQLISQFVENFKNKLAEEASTETTEPEMISSEVEPGAIGTSVPESVATEAETKKKIEEKDDNALDAGSLFGTVIKSFLGSIGDFFRRLFGGKSK